MTRRTSRPTPLLGAIAVGNRILPGNILFPCAGLLVACTALAQPDPSPHAGSAASPAPVAAEAHDPNDDVRDLLARMDAASFAVRNEATRQLAARGPEVIPLLVEALGRDSREVRFRVAELLSQQFTFDDLAPHLIRADPSALGGSVRTILRDRALRQIEETGQLQFARKLFDFWGTDTETLRRQVMFHLQDSPPGERTEFVVGPIVGLRAKADQFEQALARLESLALPYDHQHSPGFVVARTLAWALRDNDRRETEFAGRFIEAFETLSHALRDQGMTRSAVRREVVERANMSDGAVGYLVRLLDEGSAQSAVVSQRLGVRVEYLSDELFRGLATVDAKECHRCVGKVHIVDMLGELLIAWPEAPDDGVVAQLVESVTATVETGDKPKALVLLNALEACRELTAHQLDARQGLGQDLARRLLVAATIAGNIRDFHPTRTMHDRFVRLIGLGVTPDQEDLFPDAWLRDYLRGDADATSETRRAMLGRYLHAVEQLGDTRPWGDRPGTARFLSVLCRGMRADDPLGSAALDALQEAVAEPQAPDGPTDRAAALDQILGKWADRALADQHDP